MRTVPRSRATRYLEKAEEFTAAAQSELEAGRHSSAGLAAIHAAISAADAVTAHVAGVVSAGSSHTEVVRLMCECPGLRLPASAERQLLGLLRAKNDVEYTDRRIDQTAARVLVDQAKRFVAWSGSVVRR